MNYQELLEIDPFLIGQAQKEEWYCGMFGELCRHHKKNCAPYRRLTEMLDAPEIFADVSRIPAVPIQLFKERELRSIPQKDVFREIQSSGTTGMPSRVFLDEEAAKNQQLTLYRILQDVLGKKRMPMLIIDSPDVLKKKEYSARAAGIMGFSVFSSKRIYALDEKMDLNEEAVRDFAKQYADRPVLLFGFTFMIWKYFYRALKERRLKLNLKNGILFHGGGWKKMESASVSKEEFKDGLKRVTGVKQVHDYYGMAEQTGCIYIECEAGYLHASLYSDVIFRRYSDFSPCEIGEEGIVEVLSPMVSSYPGHAILTQDTGILCGIDDCPCKRKGKYFKITGRIKHSSVRGCSDTYEG